MVGFPLFKERVVITKESGCDKMGFCYAQFPIGICSGKSWALCYGRVGQKHKSTAAALESLTGESRLTEFLLYGENRGKEVNVVLRRMCSTSGAWAGRSEGGCKYINIFFQRLEIANGNELWVILLLWWIDDCTSMGNWIMDTRKNTEEKN